MASLIFPAKSNYYNFLLNNCTYFQVLLNTGVVAKIGDELIIQEVDKQGNFTNNTFKSIIKSVSNGDIYYSNGGKFMVGAEVVLGIGKLKVGVNLVVG